MVTGHWWSNDVTAITTRQNINRQNDFRQDDYIQNAYTRNDCTQNVCITDCIQNDGNQHGC